MFKLLKWGAIGFISLIVILAVADGIRNLSETDSETFERHINANHLESAENILSDNPNLEIDGEKATDILSKAKAEAEANRVAKEKAEAERAAKEKIKKEAEQLELAKSQGYNSYDEYLKVELKKAREREAKKKEKEIVETTENLSTVNYQTIFEQSLIDYYNIFSE
ncbi:MAG: hypothetical protein U9Q04_00630, partial [Campylobacterota bacterium]|nr:hypothetical protein [Campylobacterota bacterium]